MATELDQIIKDLFDNWTPAHGAVLLPDPPKADCKNCKNNCPDDDFIINGTCVFFERKETELGLSQK